MRPRHTDLVLVPTPLWSVVLAGVLAGGCAADRTPAAPASDVQIAPPGEPGPRLVLTGTLHDARGRAVAGATIRAYHMDTHGFYGAASRAPARLMGTLRTGPAGEFRVRTILPGGSIPSGGEGPHIHFDVMARGHGQQSLVVNLAPHRTPDPPPLAKRPPLLPDPIEVFGNASTGVAATLDSLGVWHANASLRLR